MVVDSFNKLYKLHIAVHVSADLSKQSEKFAEYV